jgi:hypothetical protein
MFLVEYHNNAVPAIIFLPLNNVPVYCGHFIKSQKDVFVQLKPCSPYEGYLTVQLAKWFQQQRK